jgi:hypothetical protein
MAQANNTPNGFVIYDGPSMIDGARIIAIAVGLANGSANRKTGDMIQTYILRADQSPIDAARTGSDESICGDCPHRGHIAETDTGPKNVGRTCYVNLGQGPLSVWRAWTRGAYPVAPVADLHLIGLNRLVRLGTYGDPYAVPLSIWEGLLTMALGWTGYTHQWRIAPEFARYCMASVDNEEDGIAARELSSVQWRTFRVAMPGDIERMRTESVCPASAEAEKILTCKDCLACSGTATNRRGSIVIQAHGSSAVMANVKKHARGVETTA